MIHVEVKKTNKEKPFPKLMINNSGDIVEIHEKTHPLGNYIVVWRTGCNKDIIGLQWTEETIKNGWKDFDGEITLKNE